jgi:hypothetical protein
MAGKMNFEKSLDKSNSPMALYIALVATVGFFLLMAFYACLY